MRPLQQNWEKGLFDLMHRNQNRVKKNEETQGVFQAKEKMIKSHKMT